MPKVNTPRPNLLVFDSYASRWHRKSSESLAAIHSILIGLKLTLSKITFLPVPDGHALVTFDTDPVRATESNLAIELEQASTSSNSFDLLSEVDYESISGDEEDVPDWEGLG